RSEEASHPPKRCAPISLGGPPAHGPELRLEHGWRTESTPASCVEGGGRRLADPPPCWAVPPPHEQRPGARGLSVGRPSLPERGAGRLCFRAARSPSFCASKPAWRIGHMVTGLEANKLATHLFSPSFLGLVCL